ncbi:MAG: NAD(P)H-dependent oxidoreductase subunit E, partial [Bacillota bacterium]|nr:NAD(P)H-dependent oxidoreductase subunit E [Bacillota bacterium]
ENVISVCDSSVCRVNGNAQLVELLEEALEIKMGEVTADGKFALKYTPCFGACDISPAIRINDDVYGNLNKDKVQEIINSYGEGK